METLTCDVVVVGAGNAALSAALSARERGADVLVLERAPEDERGGNSRFTAGIIRTVFNGVDDLEKLFELNAEDKAKSDFGTYTKEKFYDDLGEITNYRTNPDLAELLVTRSYDSIRWLKEKGVKMQPSYGRQAFNVNGTFKFWGGLAVETWGGGPGLVDNLFEAAKREGIKVLYEARGMKLIHDDEGIHGVIVKHKGVSKEVRAKAVILACGGFEANAEMRTKYLGPGWDMAAVRGTRFNTGDGITMALEAGASPYGNWSGCHAVAWDKNAPEFGDLAVGDGFQKHCYPWGMIVNANGERFVDEGADFRNYTYAKYGKEILNQPGQYAFQIFDKKIIPALRDEYRIREITKYSGNTIEELAHKMRGLHHTMEKGQQWLGWIVIGVVALDLLLIGGKIANKLGYLTLQPDLLHLAKLATPWLIFASAVLPAIIAALGGLRFQSECQRLADRSAVMRVMLKGHGPTAGGRYAEVDALIKRIRHECGAQTPSPPPVVGPVPTDLGSYTHEALRLSERIATDFVHEAAEWSVLYAKELGDPG